MPDPAQLPTLLSDYLPGRIHVVDEVRWPTGAWVTNSVRVLVPRYGLEVFVRHERVDPSRVRWEARRTVHPLETASVSLLHDRRLYLLRGRHLLAAHLAAGSERIPVQLFQRVPADEAGSRTAADAVHVRPVPVGAGRS